MEPYDTLEAFIDEHGFGLYMVFAGLCLAFIGLILARRTLLSHPLTPGLVRTGRPHRPRRGPPVLQPLQRRHIGKN